MPEYTIVDYIDAVGEGLENGLNELLELGKHPYTQVLQPLTLLVYDAGVIFAGAMENQPHHVMDIKYHAPYPEFSSPIDQTRLPRLEDNPHHFQNTEYREALHSDSFKNSPTYQASLARMEMRWEAIKKSGQKFSSADALKKTSMISEEAATIFVPPATIKYFGKAAKGAKALKAAGITTVTTHSNTDAPGSNPNLANTDPKMAWVSTEDGQPYQVPKHMITALDPHNRAFILHPDAKLFTPSERLAWDQTLMELGLKEEYDRLQAENGFASPAVSHAFIQKINAASHHRLGVSKLQSITEQFLHYTLPAEYGLQTLHHLAIASGNHEFAAGVGLGIQSIHFTAAALSSASIMLAAEVGTQAFLTGTLGFTAGLSGLIMVGVSLFQDKDNGEADAERWKALFHLIIDVATRLEENQHKIMERIGNVEQQVFRGFMATAFDFRAYGARDALAFHRLEQLHLQQASLLPRLSSAIDQNVKTLLTIAQQNKIEELNLLLRSTITPDQTPADRRHLLTQLYNAAAITTAVPLLTEPNTHGILPEISQYTKLPHPGIFDYHVTTLVKALKEKGYLTALQLTPIVQLTGGDFRTPALLSKIIFFSMSVLKNQYPRTEEPNEKLRITWSELNEFSEHLPRLAAEQKLRILYKNSTLHEQLQQNYLNATIYFGAKVKSVLFKIQSEMQESLETIQKTKFVDRHSLKEEQRFIDEPVPVDLPTFDCHEVGPLNNFIGYNVLARGTHPLWRGIQSDGIGFWGGRLEVTTQFVYDASIQHVDIARHMHTEHVDNHWTEYQKLTQQWTKDAKRNYWDQCRNLFGFSTLHTRNNLFPHPIKLSMPCLMYSMSGDEPIIPFPPSLAQSFMSTYTNALLFNMGEPIIYYNDSVREQGITRQISYAIQLEHQEGRLLVGDCTMVLPNSHLYRPAEGKWAAWSGDWIDTQCDTLANKHQKNMNWLMEDFWWQSHQVVPHNYVNKISGRPLESVSTPYAFKQIEEGKLEITCKEQGTGRFEIVKRVQMMFNQKWKEVALKFKEALYADPELKHAKDALNHAYYLWAGVMTQAFHDEMRNPKSQLHQYVYGLSYLRSAHDLEAALDVALAEEGSENLQKLLQHEWLNQSTLYAHELHQLVQRLSNLWKDTSNDQWLDYIQKEAALFVENRTKSIYKPVKHNRFHQSSSTVACMARIIEINSHKDAAFAAACVRRSEGDIFCNERQITEELKKRLPQDPTAIQEIQQCYQTLNEPTPMIGGQSVFMITDKSHDVVDATGLGIGAEASSVQDLWDCQAQTNLFAVCRARGGNLNVVRYLNLLVPHQHLEQVNTHIDACIDLPATENSTRKYCGGPEIEYIEEIHENPTTPVVDVLSHAALYGLAATTLSEAVGDLCRIYAHVSEPTEETIKWYVHSAWMLLSGSWANALISSQVSQSLQRLGVSGATSRVAGNAASFFATQGMSALFSPLGAAATVTNIAAGFFGIKAEKKIMAKLESKVSQCQK